MRSLIFRQESRILFRKYDSELKWSEWPRLNRWMAETAKRFSRAQVFCMPWLFCMISWPIWLRLLGFLGAPTALCKRIDLDSLDALDGWDSNGWDGLDVLGGIYDSYDAEHLICLDGSTDLEKYGLDKLRDLMGSDVVEKIHDSNVPGDWDDLSWYTWRRFSWCRGAQVA